jgi:hypothetical protein
MPVLDRDTYLTSRVDDQLRWLSHASKVNKRTFLSLRLFEIVLGTSITIISPYAASLPWGPSAIAMAGGGIALSGGWLALNRNQENWVRYRSLSESLKREKYLFLTGAPPYDVEQTSFATFVTTSEALMLDERAGWARQVSQQVETDVPVSSSAARGS